MPDSYPHPCVVGVSLGNQLTVKTDVFRVDGFTLNAAVCPQSLDWGASDDGFTRYRDVLEASGPLLRTSNTTISYDGVVSDDSNEFPVTSMAAAPACLAYVNTGNGTRALHNRSTAPEDGDCQHVTDSLHTAVVVAAVLAVLLVASWFSCCVVVWHAKQQPAAPSASAVRTTVSMVLVSMFLHIFAVALILPALTPLVVDDIFGGSTARASVFLTGA